MAEVFKTSDSWWCRVGYIAIFNQIPSTSKRIIRSGLDYTFGKCSSCLECKDDLLNIAYERYMGNNLAKMMEKQMSHCNVGAFEVWTGYLS